MGLIDYLLETWRLNKAYYGLVDKEKSKESPKGIDNPYDFYPEYYNQETSESILTPDGRYDTTRFSAHEDKTIRNVIAQANRGYASKYRGIGLANESYPITYKPRYILFDVIIIAFGDSENPLDQIAVSFAYIQKGALYRKDAIRYFETAIDRVRLYELDGFASVSVLSILTKISETYEREHEYEKAIHWLNVLVERKSGNTPYFQEKIEKLRERAEKGKPLRKRKVPREQLEFDKQTYEAALQYAVLVQK